MTGNESDAMKNQTTKPARRVLPYWQFRLYVAGQSPRSLAAIANLTKICRKYLDQNYRIEVIDLEANPRAAGADQIVALPTLIRWQPQPVRRVTGDLSDSGRVLAGMGFPNRN